MTLKLNNRKTVLSYLRSGRIVSINNIADDTGISRTTVKKIIEYLQTEGMVVFMGKGNSTDGGGKKPDLFQLNSLYGYVISICITLSDIFSVVTDFSNTIIFSNTISIREQESLDNVFLHIEHIFKRYQTIPKLADMRLLGVVVGFPGIMNAETGIGIVAPSFMSWGIQINVRERMRSIIGESVPLFIENLNRLQALSEKYYGVAKNCERFMVIDIGLGCGGAFYDRGELVQGAHHFAGEIGHMIIAPNSDVQCVCGARGCLNALIHIKALINDAEKGVSEHPQSLLAKKKGSIDADDIFNALHKGDAYAKQLLDQVIRYLTIAISNVYWLYDPEMIVIQGEYTKAGEYLLRKVREEAEKLSFCNIEKHFDVQYSSLGIEREVLGGSLLALNEFFQNIHEI